MIFDEKYTMDEGIEIPKLALGTWLMEDDRAEEAVSQALKIGYRHIDTAQAYLNEEGVGRAIRNSGIPREEIFLTSKVEAEHKSYESAKNSIDQTLEKTGLDYIDMMIIHSPQPWKEVNQSENRYFQENKGVWKALEDAKDQGKIRAIGLSNFLKEDIDNILESCRIRPMANQILCHITNTPEDLIDYCQNLGILVEAYSPIAHGEALKNEKIASMAKKYEVSPAQICLKYDLQLGLVVLPKAENIDHMRKNSQLDFEISDEDMEILKNLDKIKDYGDSSGFPVFGGKL